MPPARCLVSVFTMTGQGHEPFVALLCTVLHSTSGLSRGTHLPPISDPHLGRMPLCFPLLLGREIHCFLCSRLSHCDSPLWFVSFPAQPWLGSCSTVSAC